MKTIEQWVADYTIKANALNEEFVTKLIVEAGGLSSPLEQADLNNRGRKMLADFAAAIREEALQERRTRYEVAALSAICVPGPRDDGLTLKTSPSAMLSMAEICRLMASAMLQGVDQPDPLVHVELCGDCRGVKAVKTACVCPKPSAP